MPKFSEVFSTTGKVLLALFLISVCIGVIYAVFAAIGSGAGSADTGLSDIENKMADETHTAIPQSKWNNLIAAAIKQHCPVKGMTKQEVESALGKPMRVFSDRPTGDLWDYDRTIQGDCRKYAGENCAEYETKQETAEFEFSPSGHLRFPYHGGWLHLSCFSEPFYSKYYKSAP